jgi:hypothetical protein
VNQLHFAVCIGIDRYPGFPGRDLGSAVGDALSFTEWLLAADGGALPATNVCLITASPQELWDQPDGARPQLQEFDQALGRYNRQLRDYLAAHPEDPNDSRLYVYAAGHGFGPVDGECAVLMANAGEDTLGLHAEFSTYRMWYVAHGPFREVVIFADCCREILDIDVPANRPPFSSAAPPIGVRTHTGYAARLGELAWEPTTVAQRDAGRGYFTRALLTGLSTAPVDDTYGAVTSTTLSAFVASAVQAMTKDAPAPQFADQKSDPASPVVFRTVKDPPRYRVTFRFPAGFAGEVVVRTSQDRELRRQDLAAGPLEMELPPGLYEVARPGDVKELELFKVGASDIVVDVHG